MGRKTSIATLILGLVLCSASCGSLSRPSPKIEHYALEYTPPAVERARPLPFVVKVERFSAAPLYDTRQIIYRDKPFGRDSYVYHRWRSTPADLVTYFLARDLKSSGLFAGVLPHDSRQSPGFYLEGSVDEFLESDMENGWEAVLAFSVTLLEAKEPDISKRILFQKTYHESKPSNMRNPRALADAMSKAMEELSGRVILDVYDALEKKRPQEGF